MTAAPRVFTMNLIGNDTDTNTTTNIPTDGVGKTVVNAFITSYMATPANGEWPADVMQGATMLAARNIERRNSPVGVSQGIDGATYIPGRDRDLDQYLRLGQYRRLVVG